MGRNAELLDVPGYNMFRGSLEGTPRTAASVSATLSILPDNNHVGCVRVFRIS
jgi:alkylated DNA nucleotide flippase Atl1